MRVIWARHWCAPSGFGCSKGDDLARLTRIERLTQAERLASERQTRAERQAITRERLVEAASDLFRRDGYAITSIDRIAQAAGYTKGAVYSNFEDKEAIFLTAFGAEANENLGALLARIDEAPTREAVIEEVAQWANERSRHGGWAFPVLELARSLSPGPAGSDPATAPASVSASCSEHLEAIVRNGWRRLGEHLRARFPHGPSSPEMLGALLFEIAYAPALTFLPSPRAGDLVRLVLPGQLAGHPDGAPEDARP